MGGLAHANEPQENLEALQRSFQSKKTLDLLINMDIKKARSHAHRLDLQRSEPFPKD